MIKEYKQEIRQKERPREYLSIVLFIIYLFIYLSNCTYEFIQKYLLYTQLFVLSFVMVLPEIVYQLR